MPRDASFQEAELSEEPHVYVNICVPIEEAWLIVDALRLRGIHNLVSVVIDAIDEAANQLPSD